MSEHVTVTFPDGSTREFAGGITVAEIAASIGSRLAKAAVAGKLDGEWVDLDHPVGRDAKVEIVVRDTDAGREVLRHSTAHVMAQAVTRLFPGAQYAIGPAIAEGFYYDFALPGGQTFSDDDLARIETEMKAIVKADQRFVRSELTYDDALGLFADQPYKQEIITKVRGGDATAEDSSEVAGDGGVSVYRNVVDAGTAVFTDLCRGPHVPSTGKLGAFTLTKVAGAYWRGNEKGPMLQRIYGTAWENQKALDEYLHRVAEAERRDHRKLGTELDLFSFPDEIGSGLAVFHPKGGTVRRLMEEYSRRRHEEAGYEFVYTPHLSKSTLFERSGHLDWYADGMYPPMELDEGTAYYPKPMNCPMHLLIYRSRQRSYRELPLRLFEFGTVYRYEKSGVVHGLLRARGFTQDDSHIFCAPEQLGDELSSLLDFVLSLLRTFGFDEFEAELATRPEKFVGDPEQWEEAEAALAHAMDRAGLSYVVAEGEGAFYAPKIDVHVRDAIGRRWQVSTLQVDFQFPDRFDLEFVGADNARHRPRMIHRALFGSFERFFGILVEHTAGAFPLWLAPVQATVLPVSDRHDAYAFRIVDRLRAEGFRAEMVDGAHGALGARIRRAKIEKVPYVLVVGDDDVEHGTVGVNARGSDDPERGVRVDDFVARLEAEVAEHR